MRKKILPLTASIAIIVIFIVLLKISSKTSLLPNELISFILDENKYNSYSKIEKISNFENGKLVYEIESKTYFTNKDGKLKIKETTTDSSGLELEYLYKDGVYLLVESSKGSEKRYYRFEGGLEPELLYPNKLIENYLSDLTDSHDFKTLGQEKISSRLCIKMEFTAKEKFEKEALKKEIEFGHINDAQDKLGEDLAIKRAIFWIDRVNLGIMKSIVEYYDGSKTISFVEKFEDKEPDSKHFNLNIPEGADTEKASGIMTKEIDKKELEKILGCKYNIPYPDKYSYKIINRYFFNGEKDECIDYQIIFEGEKDFSIRIIAEDGEKVDSLAKLLGTFGEEVKFMGAKGYYLKDSNEIFMVIGNKGYYFTALDYRLKKEDLKKIVLEFVDINSCNY